MFAGPDFAAVWESIVVAVRPIGDRNSSNSPATHRHQAADSRSSNSPAVLALGSVSPLSSLATVDWPVPARATNLHLGQARAPGTLSKAAAISNAGPSASHSALGPKQASVELLERDWRGIFALAFVSSIPGRGVFLRHLHERTHDDHPSANGRDVKARERCRGDRSHAAPTASLNLLDERVVQAFEGRQRRCVPQSAEIARAYRREALRLLPLQFR